MKYPSHTIWAVDWPSKTRRTGLLGRHDHLRVGSEQYRRARDLEAVEGFRAEFGLRPKDILVQGSVTDPT